MEVQRGCGPARASVSNQQHPQVFMQQLQGITPRTIVVCYYTILGQQVQQAANRRMQHHMVLCLLPTVGPTVGRCDRAVQCSTSAGRGGKWRASQVGQPDLHMCLLAIATLPADSPGILVARNPRQGSASKTAAYSIRKAPEPSLSAA